MANESRLIDMIAFREVLRRYLNAPHVRFPHDYCRGLRDAIKACLDLLENQRPVDAVEVVRCKDCKNYDDEGYCWFWKYETGMSPNEVEPDAFCSYGERKGND